MTRKNVMYNPCADAIPGYSRFVHVIQGAMRQAEERKYESLGLRIKE